MSTAADFGGTTDGTSTGDADRSKKDSKSRKKKSTRRRNDDARVWVEAEMVAGVAGAVAEELGEKDGEARGT